MGSNVTTWACPAAGSPHGCPLAGGGAAPGLADGRALAVAALVSWLIAEGLGAYMLGTWIAVGGPRQQRARPDGIPLPVIFGHAGMAFTGFAGWVSFLVTGSPALAWLAIGFLVPAVGLGISTVTVWTPYPARRAVEPPTGPGGDGPASQGPGEGGLGDKRARDGPGGHGSGSGASAVPPGHAHGDDVLAGQVTDEMLARSLSDEVLTSRLVDDLLASMLAVDAPAARRPKGNLAALIPAAHGVFAIATFLLAILAAVAAT